MVKNTREMIHEGPFLVKTILGKKNVSKFLFNVCDCRPAIQKIEDLDTPDKGAKMFHKVCRQYQLYVALFRDYCVNY